MMYIMDQLFSLRISIPYELHLANKLGKWYIKYSMACIITGGGTMMNPYYMFCMVKPNQIKYQ